MLYQQSFDSVTEARGKHQAREWKKGLKISFIRSHWLLPYPQSQSFMRKGKDTGQVVWWSSYHAGLDRYYKQLERHGPLTQPFPASHLKHYPANGWTLARQHPKYMLYEVQPEQSLLDILEADLYQQLLQMGEMPENTSGNDIAAARAYIIEYNIKSIIKDPSWKAGPVEHYKTVNSCSIRLNEELEKYELLQHYSQNKQHKRRNKIKQAIGFESDSDSAVNVSSDAEVTSDDDCLYQTKKRQAELIRKVEQRMHTLIAKDRERYKGTQPNLWEPVLKMHQPRLIRVK